MGPNAWLGRTWITNPVEGWYPTDVPQPLAPAVDIVRTLHNATYIAGLEFVGFEGPFSNPTLSGDTYPVPVGTPSLAIPRLPLSLPPRPKGASPVRCKLRPLLRSPVVVLSVSSRAHFLLSCDFDKDNLC